MIELLAAFSDPLLLVISAVLFVASALLIRADKKRIESISTNKDELCIRLNEALGPGRIANTRLGLTPVGAHIDPDVKEFLLRYAMSPSENSKRFQLLELPPWLRDPPEMLLSRRLPAIQTSLGVLGTFWGIASALVSSDPDFTSSAALLTSAENLWLGMAGAFNTSILGLFSAIVTMAICLPRMERRRNEAHKKWLEGWEQVVYWPNPSRLIAAQPEQQLSAAAQQMSDASASVQESVTGLNASVGEMSTAITKLAEQQQTDSADMLKQVLDTFEQGPMKKLTEQLERTSTASEAALEVVSTLKENLDTFQNTMNQAHEAVETQLEAFQSAYLEKFQTYLDSANETLATALNEHKEGINLVVENLRDATREEAEARTQLVTDLTALINEMTNKAEKLKKMAVELKLNDAAALTTLSESGKQLAVQTSKMASQIKSLKSSNDALQETQQTIIENQQELLKGSGQEIAGFLEKLKQNREEQTAELDQSAARIAIHLTTAADALAVAVSDLKARR